jgi:hypothetical protein
MLRFKKLEIRKEKKTYKKIEEPSDENALHQHMNENVN